MGRKPEQIPMTFAFPSVMTTCPLLGNNKELKNKILGFFSLPLLRPLLQLNCNYILMMKRMDVRLRMS